MKSLARQVVTTLVLAVIIFLVLQATLQSSIVVGSSMEPTFNQGQRLVVSKLAYRFGDPARGDVIIFHPPANGAVDYIKRVVGLPGDTLEIKSGVVYINGQALYEPYITEPPDYTLKQREIPGDYYFVLGDNRNNSNDSHTGWLLPRQNIIGKAWLSIWPPSEWQVVGGFSPN